MNAQRPNSWPARVVLGFLLGMVVALLALVGYQPVGRSADASFQPQPTTVAFVPLYPEQQAQAQRLGGVEAFRANIEALYAEPAQVVVQTDTPAPVVPDVIQNDSCAFPCVGSADAASPDDSADAASPDDSADAASPDDSADAASPEASSDGEPESEPAPAASPEASSDGEPESEPSSVASPDPAPTAEPVEAPDEAGQNGGIGPDVNLEAAFEVPDGLGGETPEGSVGVENSEENSESD